ncbi:hypothetical protein GCM10023328_25490 [Modestobacter marinus]|uniref:Uncharacterized protein n=1 Tax=Modestobacter marinus TaxID=477641 RepID=A0ABQ2FWY0_9ACTN|nr:hypothetical protein GCM10011589_17390 [Modestobacter marinus]
MRDGRRCGAYPGRGRHPARHRHRPRRTALSEDDTTATGEDQAAVLQFVGGPLDGRVEIREARHGEPLPTITHTHLHGGPKVVHRYDLRSLTDSAGVYHLRPRTSRDDGGATD